MAENTKIEWCHHTFNCWRGCTKVSAGCANCYADTLSKRNPLTLGVWGPNGTRVVASESKWKEPLKWNREAAEWPYKCGSCPAVFGPSARAQFCGICKGTIVANRPRVFCASLADVFEKWPGDMTDSQGRRLWVDRICARKPDAPWLHETPQSSFAALRPLTMDDVRRRLFRLIVRTSHIDYLLLTKRIENVGPMLWDTNDPQRIAASKLPPNVWLGTTVEDQKAKSRIDVLRNIPAAVRFLSCEPLIEDLGTLDLTGIHWVIVGGESGAGSRACRIEWIGSVVKQCRDQGVPVFVKQLGQRPTSTLPDGEEWPGGNGLPSSGRIRFNGDGFGNYSVLGLRDKKGGDMTEWPEPLRMRQFPAAGVERVACVHCVKRINCRPRGLCEPCHRNRAVRNLYPVPDRQKPAARGKRVCRHCKRCGVNRPRELCWTCYYAPGVKQLYPPTSKYARRGYGCGNKATRLPETVTDAEPGSDAKMDVMIARAKRGESLFHPDDKASGEGPVPTPHRWIGGKFFREMREAA